MTVPPATRQRTRHSPRNPARRAAVAQADARNALVVRLHANRDVIRALRVARRALRANLRALGPDHPCV
ncbi:MAG TPA: tetratricopeptide repeat protein, partial [Kofleriaceae bacterium]|nr:tetratricopeptide repeat protein [Kofleriaceae bacterium]